MSNATYVGVDVGASWLDLARYGSETVKRVQNTESGFAEALEWMAELEPSLIVVEATGGYEQAFVRCLLAEGWQVSVANPTRVRALAKATGKLAKTDAIDARLIAEYAAKITPEPMRLTDEKGAEFRALVRRRAQIVEMRTMERNRLKTAPPYVRESILAHIDWLTKEIKSIESKLRKMLRELPTWKKQVDLLKTIPGVGFVTAITVLSELPELGTVDNKKIAALAGLAPYNRDSGRKHGKRRIFGGRKSVRGVLYMASLSARNHNAVIRTFYQRLESQGKKFKVSITACMRKLLTIMNAMLRDGTPWAEPSRV